MQIIIDDNLTLQLIQPSHAEALFDLVMTNSVYLKEWLPWVIKTKTMQDTLDYISIVDEAYYQKKGIAFSIFYKQKIAGQIGLKNIDLSNKYASIGYWIGQQYQGKGIMSKSVVALVNYAFRAYHLNRLEIACGDHNIKSQAIPIRLGFQKEGVLRQREYIDGKFIDLYLYAMVKNEWKH